MKTYGLARGLVWFLRLGAIFALAIIVAIGVSITTNPQDDGGTIFFIVWLVYAGSLLFFGLRTIPHHVTIDDKGRVVFSMIGRSVEVQAGDIASIRPVRFDINRQFVLLRYEEGGRSRKLRLPTAYEGFHQMLNQLNSLNPQIDMERL
jgi:hypothetical protein